MRLDPMVSLANAIHSGPRQYALLLGSGVSHSAGILTGRQVLDQLIGRIRSLDGAGGGEDNFEWFATRFGEPPHYSTVIEQLAPKPHERQVLLSPFFEPNASAPESGNRRPTAAHRAIARLAKRRFVQVIVTTNFDRLVETALTDQGLDPVVISSESQASEIVAVPFEAVLVFKLHGDYRAPSIRNTREELKAYGPKTSALLNQICQSYGLVVCGWSAEWDPALRSAFEADAFPRFSTYWASRGEPKEQAQALILARNAKVVLGRDADSFFEELSGKVLSLEATPLPSSPPASPPASPTPPLAPAEEARRLIRVDGGGPQLHRLVQSEVERARTALVAVASVDMPRDLPAPSVWIPTAHRLLGDVYSVCMPASRWADRQQVPVLEEVIQRLYQRPATSDGSMQVDSSYWAVPSFLAFHVVGASIAGGRNWSALFDFLTGTQIKTHVGFSPYIIGVDWIPIQDQFRQAFGEDRWGLVAKKWLLGRWHEIAASEVPSDQDREEAFLRFELSVALAYRALMTQPSPAGGRSRLALRDDTRPWLPPGLYNWRASLRGGQRQFADELMEDRKFDAALREFAASLPESVAVAPLYECLRDWLRRTDQSFL
jgi:hypothetical protein